MDYRAHVRFSDSTELGTVVGDLHVFDDKSALVAEIKHVILRNVDGAVPEVPRQPSSPPHSESEHAVLPQSALLTIPNENAVADDIERSVPSAKSCPPTSMTRRDPLPTSSFLVPFDPPINAESPTSEFDSQDKNTFSSSTDAVLSILASELGLDLLNANKDEPLEDLGVDSIMAMTLFAQMQKGVGGANDCRRHY